MILPNHHATSRDGIRLPTVKTSVWLAASAGMVLSLLGCSATTDDAEPEKASVAEWCDDLVLNGLDEIVDVDADDFETPDAWKGFDSKDFDYEIQQLQFLKEWEHDLAEDGFARQYISFPTRDGFVDNQTWLLGGLVDNCRTAGAEVSADEETELHNEVATLAGEMFDYVEAH